MIAAKISRTSNLFQDIPTPQYSTPGSAGMDLCAALEDSLAIGPGESVLIPTGFIVELPEGYEAQIRPRSGLAIRHQIGVLNSPGTIDSDYRGEVKIILTNFGKTPFVVHRGDRIAQMIVAKVERVGWEEIGEVAESERGAGGFGHTGISTNLKNGNGE
jgi:dUTP pyrophosphatase